MIEAYGQRDLERLPLWKVFWYKRAEDYARKLVWYSNALADLPHESSVLDIGCGTGEVLAWCELPGDYCGIDVVPKFISTAQARFSQRRFICGDVLTMTLTPVDTVIMMGILGSSPKAMALIERACSLAQRNVFFDYFPTEVHSARSSPLRRLPPKSVEDQITRAGFKIICKENVGASIALQIDRGIDAD